MTGSEREHIVSVIQNWIQMNGGIPLAKLKWLLRNSGISDAVFEGEGPKNWIKERFPEFLIDGTNGHERILLNDGQHEVLENLTKPSISFRDKIKDIILNNMSDEGFALLSNIPAYLRTEKIEWRDYAGGKKLYEWLTDEYPDTFIVPEDDKLRLYKKEGNALFEKEGNKYSLNVDPVTKNHVYHYCFTPGNAAIARQIKELTGTMISNQQWSALRLTAIARCLIGLDGGILDDKGAEHPREAFYVGLKTEKNQKIYGIMERNNHESAVQDWLFKAIAFPGQETDEGRWLCSAFGLGSQDEGISSRMDVVGHALKVVQQTQSDLVSYVDIIKHTIQEGRMFPTNVSELIQQYISEWKDLENTLDNANAEVTQDHLSLLSVQKLLDEWSDTHSTQERITEQYRQLVESSWKFMDENMLCADNCADDDITEWTRLLAQNIDLHTITNLRIALSPYQALITLRSFGASGRRVLEEKEYQALEAVNEHFNAKLKLDHLKYSILNLDADMSFLNVVPEISAFVKQLEDELVSVHDDIDDFTLLDMAIKGKLWDVFRSTFRIPNPLEEAIMLGDTDKVRDLLKANDAGLLNYTDSAIKKLGDDEFLYQFAEGITPVNAAKRLEGVFGESCDLIEQCLLLGVMQREDEATERLISRYLSTDRPELARVAFRELTHLLPTDVRRKLLLDLIKWGMESVEETLQTDILTFLTDEGKSVVEVAELDESTRAQLLNLYEQVKSPLLHHIVFLSPELQSYIMNPENSAELGKYGISPTEEGALGLLRKNSFAKGSSPIQVALRVNAFLGDHGELAYQFAQLVSNAQDREDFLFDLYVSRDDDLSVLQLLERSVALKEKHFSYYVDLLFAKDEYQTLFDLLFSKQSLSTREKIELQISAVNINHPMELLPDVNAEDLVENSDLLVRLARDLASYNLEQYKELLWKVFQMAINKLPEDCARDLITNEIISEKNQLRMLAEESLERCPALTAYCGRLLQVSNYDEIRDTYIHQQYLAMESADYDQKREIIHGLQIIQPEKFSTLMFDHLKLRLKELLEQNAPPYEKATNISRFLRDNPLFSEYFLQMLALFEEASVVIQAPVYQQLLKYAVTEDDKVALVRLLYAFREAGDESFLLFLCQQYINLCQSDSLPDVLLNEAESLLTDMLSHLSGAEARSSVLRIEERLGRHSFAEFARCRMAQEDLESEAGERAELAELVVFCDALESDNVNIEEYLHFCAAFMGTHEFNIENQESSDATDVISVLHALYRHPQSTECWSAVEKQIPQERSLATAKILYYIALYQGKEKKDEPWKIEKILEKWTVGKADAAWERCVEYCMSENQDGLFFRALHDWLCEINEHYAQDLPWYALKHFMKTLHQLLEDSDSLLNAEKTIEFPVCEPEFAELLISDMIDSFKRIEKSESRKASGDANHKSLMILVEMGIRLNCEQLLIDRLGGELCGEHINIGLALICRMILQDKFETVQPFIRIFSNSPVRECNYGKIVKKLASMNSENELEEWLRIEKNSATLKFILPDGDKPNLTMLQELVMVGCRGDSQKREICIGVVENLLDCYPNDVLCYAALFILCKEEYTGYLQRIHRSLVGVFKFSMPNRRWQFTRSQDEIIQKIVILRQVMEATGEALLDVESITDLVRSYYHLNDKNSVENELILNDKVSQLNRLTEEVKGMFVGVPIGSNSFKLLFDALMGSVTANWEPFFYGVYAQKPPHFTLKYKLDQFCEHGWGKLRGALRVWRGLPEEKRDDYLSWLCTELQEKPTSNVSVYIARQLENISSKTDAATVNWDMLRLPWEEHMVCIGINAADSAVKNSCYKVMMQERIKGQSARHSFILMFRLAQDDMKFQLLYGNSEKKGMAQIWFQRGNFALAADAFGAIAVSKIIPKSILDREYFDRAEFLEYSETWMRLATVFAEGITKVNCSAHSFMNMMVELINAGYVKYFDKLFHVADAGKKKLFLAVRKVLTADLKEEEIIQLTREEFRQEQEREHLIAFLYFVLSENYQNRLFISDTEKRNSLSERLERLEDGISAKKRENNYWFPLKVRPPAEMIPTIDIAEEDQENDPFYVPADITGSDNTSFLDSEMRLFCREGAEQKELDELINEYQALYGDFTRYDTDEEYYSNRVHMSAQICALTEKMKNSQPEKDRAVVQFGKDYYVYQRFLVGKSESPNQERSKMRRTMLELVVFALRAPTVTDDVMAMLPNWFPYSIRGFATIDSLLEDFSNHRAGYAAVGKILSDTEDFDTVNTVLEILSSLLSAASKMGSKTLDIQAYQNAQARLSNVTATRDWREMVTALHELLRKAINKLDQRPSINLRIFNETIGIRNDSIYGEVENTGRIPAIDIELQATFPRNKSRSASALYQLTTLRPGEKAAFAVQYYTDEEMLELEYILNLSYKDKETRVFMEPWHGNLTLSEKKIAPGTPKFETTTSHFTVDERGEIVSRYFKGRTSEIRSLTNLLSGDHFSYYQSAIIQGVKRSGKTSLLNYLSTYIAVKKNETAIPLYFDCQNVTVPRIYKTFFKPVLEKLPLEYPQILSHPDWAAFVSRWKVNEGEKDREPDDLELFYLQLHRMLDGKGLYMIIDEFDVLLKDLAADEGYDQLLRSLRKLQMDSALLRAVHILLCGSNQLMVYNRTGNALNQMFQSFEQIQVGQMLIPDIQDMIMALIDDHPYIHFPVLPGDPVSPTIRWIEKYTGGLVWHTRLLVNAAIKRVIDNNRDCVYPSDIAVAFSSICNSNNCRMLLDGCGENEKLVIDAIQSLCVSPRTFVSLEQLMPFLESKLSAESVVESLSILTDSIALLEQEAPHIRRYRFRVELYRRYFRSWGTSARPRANSDDTDGDTFVISTSGSSIETTDGDSAFNYY